MFVAWDSCFLIDACEWFAIDFVSFSAMSMIDKTKKLDTQKLNNKKNKRYHQHHHSLFDVL
jgi:hypothetical protein